MITKLPSIREPGWAHPTYTLNPCSHNGGSRASAPGNRREPGVELVLTERSSLLKQVSEGGISSHTTWPPHSTASIQYSLAAINQ